ncbi:uncharacterized protein LOC129952920 [Eupeodes corollae]|uniref:uncharacterized protein LOC129952920 n=1 Tax=Eupeodes corollae TaxID=290404 RepID=UPI002493053C|nr:uncharacterized protein LOC129952920 [Eupeodes corollae]
MESKTKRSRTPNWDSSDKILLRQLIEDKIQIIENKNVDTNTSRMKRDAWREITDSFNSLSATMRETSQIQAQWRGTKMKAKAEMSAFQRNLRATGGGPPPKSPEPENIKLMALIPHEFEVDTNEFDCDTEMIKENVTSVVVDDEYEDVFFVEDESPRKYMPSTSSPKVHAPSPPIPSPKPPPPSPPPLDAFCKKKSASFKRKINCKDGELLKKELFQFAMANRRAEKEFMELEHQEKMKGIIMEREIKLKTLNMEHAEREKMLEMERRHKEEMHQLKMRKLEEHFSL